MSETDSFIDEVSEELRRDQLFALMRKWGWVAILAVVLLVGGAAFNEVRKARASKAAQELGDQLIAALEVDEGAARAEALGAIEAPGAGGQVARMFAAAEADPESDPAGAVAALEAIATDEAAAPIYRDIARFKALLLQGETLDPAARKAGFETLAVPGKPLRLLAEEQIALIEAETGETAAAIARLSAIAEDSEVTQTLRNRVSQLIVFLGGAQDTEQG